MRSTNNNQRVKQYYDTLHEVALFLKDNFVNRKVTYCTDNDKIDLSFKRTNYMHLCGIEYKDGASKFFKDCLNKRLVVEKIVVKDDGTTFQKLQVLSSVKELLSSHVCLTSRGVYLHLSFDYALRTRKQILALTLLDQVTEVVPQSLLALKNMKQFAKGDPVRAIYSKHNQSGECIVHYKDNNYQIEE